MVWRATYMLVLWTLCCTVSVNGYQIDKSCESAGILPQIQDALNQAFAFAHAGIDALQRGADMYETEEWEDELDPPRPQELNDLIKLVFAHDDIINDKVPNLGDPFYYKMNMRNLKLYKVYAVLRDIIKHIEKPGPTDSPGANDVTIYCDGKRLSYSRNKLYVLDTEKDNIRMGTRFGSAHDCAEKYPIVYSTMAVTWGMLRGDTRKGQKHKYPSVMQLCKGTVENIKKGTYGNYQGFKESNLLAKWANHRTVSQEKKFGFRHIDAINQLDLLLLHELTHTRMANLDDVKVQGLATFGIPQVAYRWDKIKMLAKSKPYVDTKAKKAADNNADTVAYFALGCYLMSTTDESGAFAIHADGRVRQLDKPVVFNK